MPCVLSTWQLSEALLSRSSLLALSPSHGVAWGKSLHLSELLFPLMWHVAESYCLSELLTMFKKMLVSAWRLKTADARGGQRRVSDPWVWSYSHLMGARNRTQVLYKDIKLSSPAPTAHLLTELVLGVLQRSLG